MIGELSIVQLLWEWDSVMDWHMPAGESNVCCGEIASLDHLSS